MEMVGRRVLTTTPQSIHVTATIIEFHIPFVYFIIEKDESMLIVWEHISDLNEPLRVATMPPITSNVGKTNEGGIVLVSWKKRVY